MYGQWSECSVTCGGGTRHRTAVCVDSESNTLDDDKCSAIVPKKTQICQAETCPIWKTGDWTEVEIYQFKYSKCVEFIILYNYGKLDNNLYFIFHGKCNVTCGKGIKQRPYWCEVKDRAVEGRYCSNESIPKHMQICHARPCASWFLGTWSEVCKTARSES